MIVADERDEVIAAVLITANYHSAQDERFSWVLDRTSGIFLSSWEALHASAPSAPSICQTVS